MKGMEVQFTPETEKKLKELVAQSGRGTNDLLEDATAAYLHELLQARNMLDNRYDDLKSGRVKAIHGEEAFARLKAKLKHSAIAPDDRSRPSPGRLQRP